jgi:hypothetical protein
LNLYYDRVATARPAARIGNRKLCITVQFGFADHSAFGEGVGLRHQNAVARLGGSFVQNELAVTHQLFYGAHERIAARGKAIGISNRRRLYGTASAEIHTAPGANILLGAVFARASSLPLVAYAVVLPVHTLFLRRNAQGGKHGDENNSECSFHFFNSPRT